MAIDTGLINAVSRANPQFLDVRESFGKSFENTFSGINADVKAEKDKLDSLEKKRAKEAEELYRNAPLVEENKVPEKFRSAFTKKAMDLKKGYADLISNKANMDPMEFIDEQNKYKTSVGDINKQVESLGIWQAEYIQANGMEGNELISQSMTADEQETIDKIFNGELPIEYRDGKMGFVNNKEFLPIDNLPKLKEKATKEHLALQNLATSVGEKIGAKGEGVNGELYNYEINKLKENISQLGDNQIDSLFADFTGLAGEKGFAASYLKGMSKPEKIEKIFNHYKQAADTGAKVYKDQYDKKLSEAERAKQASQKPTSAEIKAAEQEVKFTNMLNDFNKDPFDALKQTTIGSNVSKDGNVISIVTAKAETEDEEDTVLKFDITDFNEKAALSKLWASNSGLVTDAEATDFNTFFTNKSRGKKGKGFEYKPGKNMDPVEAFNTLPKSSLSEAQALIQKYSKQ